MRAQGVALAYWRSNSDLTSANGGDGGRVMTMRAIGQVEVESGYQMDGTPPPLCVSGTLHASMRPQDWRGERLWVVGLYPPVTVGTGDHEGKFGSRKRVLLAEVPNFFVE